MRKLIFLAILLALASITHCEEWMTFTTDDGLAHNECRCIAVDHDGVVWVGSGDLPTCTGGVSAWDGETWTTYYSWTTDFALRSNVINDIFVDSENNKWFATGTIGSIGGVTKFDGENWTSHNFDETINPYIQWTYAISQDKFDNIWAGSELGILVFNGISWECVYGDSLDSDGFFRHIFYREDSLIQISSGNGIYLYNYDNFNILEYSEDLRVLNSIYINEEVLFTTYRGGLYKYSDSTTEVYTEIDGRSLSNATAIEIIDSNTVWFATNHIFEYNMDSIYFLPRPYIDGFGIILDFEVDLYGNIWFNNGSNGIIIFNKNIIVWCVSDVKPIKTNIARIYPNPVRTKCYIENISSKKIITNLKGEIIAELGKDVNFYEPDNKVSSGLYIVSFYENGKPMNLKICILK